VLQIRIGETRRSSIDRRTLPNNVTNQPKRVARVLLVACMAAAVAAPFLVLSPAAAAQVPCWKRLLNDWYDGQIESTYPIPCYQQAINHLPTDVEQYSSARDDINRALQAAIAAQQPPTTTGSSGVVPPPTTTTTPGSTTTTPTTTTTPPATTTPTNGRPDKKGLAGALDKLNPGSADAFPLPLLVLGALAIALVVAGVVGMLWRRAQEDSATP